MSIEPKVRNNVCMNADPEGCRRLVRQMIAREKGKAPLQQGPKRVLVIGSSTGYGLSTRITAAFGGGAHTVGVSFEKPHTEKRPGTPGWYNNRTFEEEARAQGLKAETFEGDAFSLEMKARVIEYVKEELGSLDMVVYSLASGVRTDPFTGETYRSVLKPVGKPYRGITMDVMTGVLAEKEIEPATEEEAAATVKVMGGEDWKLWIQELKNAGVLAEGCFTMSYSYIGPELTYPLYREGTIGRAKAHLENTAEELRTMLSDMGGDARVSINKALVTRASSVIPAMGPYMAVLFAVMKEKGLHEGCEEQIDRLFRDLLDGRWGAHPAKGSFPVDAEGRLRVDDWEMREDVQAEVARRLADISEEKLKTRDDFQGYRHDFLQIHGFEVEK